MFKWFFGLPLLLLVAACTAAGSEPHAQSPFWDGTEDVRGSDAFLTYDEDATFGDMVGAAEAVVSVRIEGVHDVELLTVDRSNYTYEDPADKERDEVSDRITDSWPTKTTYSGKVESWIKGSGESTLLVTGMGGVSSLDGTSHYPDGFFLLEPGRSYLLLLLIDDQGNYSYLSARESFDLTDGVKVLDNPITREFEYLEDMSVDEFVAQVREFAKTN